jgi:hypothetical protein
MVQNIPESRPFPREKMPCPAGPVLACLMLLAHLSWGTPVSFSGHVVANAFWSDTVRITGDVFVDSAVTLTLNGGTCVIFQGHYGLNVKGRLLAVGGPADSIRFWPNDTATGWNGMVFWPDSNPADTSTIAYCRLQYSRTTLGRGTVYSNAGTRLVVAHSSISNNVAQYGGAVYCSGASPEITDNLMDGNSAADGGAIYCENSAAPFIARNRITRNTSSYGGGGIRCHGASGVISDNDIDSNTATTLGGGIGLRYYAGPQIIGNRLIGNSSKDGGGIYIENSGPQIYRNILRKNSATRYGGAIHVFSYSHPLVASNLIWENTAGYGGGISVYYYTGPAIANNTLYGNTGSYGGGIYVGLATPVFTNNIIWSTTGASVYLYDKDAQASFYYCDIQGGRAGFAGGGTPVQYTNNFDVDPGFTASGSGDFSLASISPCIDAGKPDTAGLGLFGLDLAGNSRIHAGRVDIGACEFQGITPVAFFPLDSQFAEELLPYTGTIAASGFPTPSYSLLLGPSGLTFDPLTRKIAWTPSLGQVGKAVVRIDAGNGQSRDTVEFSITVATHVPLPPIIIFPIKNALLSPDSALLWHRSMDAALTGKVFYQVQFAVDSLFTDTLAQADSLVDTLFRLSSLIAPIPFQVLGTVYWRVNACDNSGYKTGYTSGRDWFVFVNESLAEKNPVKDKFCMLPVRLKPFNPTAFVSFMLPRALPVQLSVYDIHGHLVETLVNGMLTSGIHSVGWRPRRHASACYLFRLKAGTFVAVEKVTQVQ